MAEAIADTLQKMVTTTQPNSLACLSATSGLIRKAKDDDGNDTYEINVYRGLPANESQITEQMFRLLKAFSYLKKEDIGTIADYAQRIKMPADQLRDAVDYNIINNKGFLKPADILSYGKWFKLLTYDEWCRRAEKNMDTASVVVEIKGHPYRILYSDAQRYNIDINKLKKYLEANG